jgi:hypothetical protein
MYPIKQSFYSLYWQQWLVARSKKTKLPVTKPEKVGMSADRLNQIKPAMQRYIAK